MHAISPAVAEVPGAEWRYMAVNLRLVGYDTRHATAFKRKNMTANDGLEAVFMANRPALSRYIRARFRMDGEAEDILQDLWLKLSTLETGPVAEPLAYLYRMAENLTLDRRRSTIRRGIREG